MKIIQVTGSDMGGGAEAVVRQHHQELSRQGHDAHLLVGRKQSDTSNTTQIPFRRGPKGALRTARWIQRTTGLQNLYSPAFRAIENVFPFAPDVIHFHSLHGVDSFAELSVVRRLSRKFPVIISLHDLWLMTGHCGHPLDCPRWKTGCGHCPDLTLYPAIPRDATRWNYVRKQRLFSNTQAQLIVPSRWLADRVDESPILKHLPVTVVPNPVDLTTFQPLDASHVRESFSISAEERTIILVAQHLTNPFKGIQDGIDVLNRITTPNTKVILVGGAAQAVAEQLALPSLVLPYTNCQYELAKYYSLADILLMPSRGETFGLVAAEAMACGTPVVAFDVGGLPDVIGNDIGGLLIKDRDLNAMARGIEMLLGDEALRIAKSDAARRRATELFPLERHTQACVALYENAIRLGAA